MAPFITFRSASIPTSHFGIQYAHLSVPSDVVSQRAIRFMISAIFCEFSRALCSPAFPATPTATAVRFVGRGTAYKQRVGVRQDCSGDLPLFGNAPGFHVVFDYKLKSGKFRISRFGILQILSRWEVVLLADYPAAGIYIFTQKAVRRKPGRLIFGRIRVDPHPSGRQETRRDTFRRCTPPEIREKGGTAAKAISAPSGTLMPHRRAVRLPSNDVHHHCGRDIGRRPEAGATSVPCEAGAQYAVPSSALAGESRIGPRLEAPGIELRRELLQSLPHRRALHGLTMSGDDQRTRIKAGGDNRVVSDQRAVGLTPQRNMADAVARSVYHRHPGIAGTLPSSGKGRRRPGHSRRHVPRPGHHQRFTRRAIELGSIQGASKRLSRFVQTSISRRGTLRRFVLFRAVRPAMPDLT